MNSTEKCCYRGQQLFTQLVLRLVLYATQLVVIMFLTSVQHELKARRIVACHKCETSYAERVYTSTMIYLTLRLLDETLLLLCVNHHQNHVEVKINTSYTVKTAGSSIERVRDKFERIIQNFWIIASTKHVGMMIEKYFLGTLRRIYFHQTKVEAEAIVQKLCI